MPPGLIHNACKLESTGVLMLGNVNKLQHFEACLHFLASKCLLTQVRLPYKSNWVNPSHNTLSKGNKNISLLSIFKIIIDNTTWFACKLYIIVLI